MEAALERMVSDLLENNTADLMLQSSNNTTDSIILQEPINSANDSGDDINSNSGSNLPLSNHQCRDQNFDNQKDIKVDSQNEPNNNIHISKNTSNDEHNVNMSSRSNGNRTLECNSNAQEGTSGCGRGSHGSQISQNSETHIAGELTSNVNSNNEHDTNISSIAHLNLDELVQSVKEKLKTYLLSDSPTVDATDATDYEDLSEASQDLINLNSTDEDIFEDAIEELGIATERLNISDHSFITAELETTILNDCNLDLTLHNTETSEPSNVSGIANPPFNEDIEHARLEDEPPPVCVNQEASTNTNIFVFGSSESNSGVISFKFNTEPIVKDSPSLIDKSISNNSCYNTSKSVGREREFNIVVTQPQSSETSLVDNSEINSDSTSNIFSRADNEFAIDGVMSNVNQLNINYLEKSHYDFGNKPIKHMVKNENSRMKLDLVPVAGTSKSTPAWQVVLKTDPAIQTGSLNDNIKTRPSTPKDFVSENRMPPESIIRKNNANIEKTAIKHNLTTNTFPCQSNLNLENTEVKLPALVKPFKFETDALQTKFQFGSDDISDRECVFSFNAVNDSLIVKNDPLSKDKLNVNTKINLINSNKVLKDTKETTCIEDLDSDDSQESENSVESTSAELEENAEVVDDGKKVYGLLKHKNNIQSPLSDNCNTNNASETYETSSSSSIENLLSEAMANPNYDEISDSSQMRSNNCEKIIETDNETINTPVSENLMANVNSKQEMANDFMVKRIEAIKKVSSDNMTWNLYSHVDVNSNFDVQPHTLQDLIWEPRPTDPIPFVPKNVYNGISHIPNEHLLAKMVDNENFSQLVELGKDQNNVRNLRPTVPIPTSNSSVPVVPNHYLLGELQGNKNFRQNMEFIRNHNNVRLSKPTDPIQTINSGIHIVPRNDNNRKFNISNEYLFAELHGNENFRQNMEFIRNRNNARLPRPATPISIGNIGIPFIRRNDYNRLSNIPNEYLLPQLVDNENFRQSMESIRNDNNGRNSIAHLEANKSWLNIRRWLPTPNSQSIKQSWREQVPIPRMGLDQRQTTTEATKYSAPVSVPAPLPPPRSRGRLQVTSSMDKFEDSIRQCVDSMININIDTLPSTSANSTGTQTLQKQKSEKITTQSTASDSASNTNVNVVFKFTAVRDPEEKKKRCILRAKKVLVKSSNCRYDPNLNVSYLRGFYESDYNGSQKQHDRMRGLYEPGTPEQRVRMYGLYRPNYDSSGQQQPRNRLSYLYQISSNNSPQQRHNIIRECQNCQRNEENFQSAFSSASQTKRRAVSTSTQTVSEYKRNMFYVDHGGVTHKVDPKSGQACYFTIEPITTKQTIVFQINETLSFECNVNIGFTSCTPEMVKSFGLRGISRKWVKHKGYWEMKSLDGLVPGDIVYIWLTSLAEVMVKKNDSDASILMKLRRSIPQVWSFIDFGLEVREIKFFELRTDKPQSINVRRNETVLGECSICFDNPIDAVLYKCGHSCLCHACALDRWQGRGEGLCPICRETITDVIKMYV